MKDRTLFFIIVIAGVLLVLISILSPFSSNEFYSKCVKNTEECDYDFLTKYVIKAPPSSLTKSDVSSVLLSKYNEVKLKYENENITDYTCSHDRGLQYVMRLAEVSVLFMPPNGTINGDVYGPRAKTPLLDMNELDFWSVKLLLIDKESWVCTPIQVRFFQLFTGSSHRKEPEVQFTINGLSGLTPYYDQLIRTRICDKIPQLQDLRNYPSTEIDVCNVFNYMKVKSYCLQKLTDEEKSLLDETKSQVSSDPEAQACIDNLKRLQWCTDCTMKILTWLERPPVQTCSNDTTSCGTWPDCKILIMLERCYDGYQRNYYCLNNIPKYNQICTSYCCGKINGTCLNENICSASPSQISS